MAKLKNLHSSRTLILQVLIGLTIVAGCQVPPKIPPWPAYNYFFVVLRPSLELQPDDTVLIEYLSYGGDYFRVGPSYEKYRAIEKYRAFSAYLDKDEVANLPIVKFNNLLNDPARDAPLKYFVLIPEKPKTLPAGMSAEKLWDLVKVYDKYGDQAALEKIWQDLVSAGYPYAGTVQIGDKKELPSWENW